MKLSNLFNFFRKKSTIEETESQSKEVNQPEASITYYMLNGQGPMIDISLDDYDNESLESLTVLLKTLSTDVCFVETVEMIKDGLVKDGKQDILLKLLINLGEIASKKMMNAYKESGKDKPCIKPSDMLR